MIHGSHAVGQLYDVCAAWLLPHVGGEFVGEGGKELLNTVCDVWCGVVWLHGQIRINMTALHIILAYLQRGRERKI